MSLKELVELWNPWLSTGEVPESLKGTARDISQRVEKWLDEKWIKVLVGPRRAGKTTVMYQLVDSIVKRKGPEKAIYLNFEDPELREAGFRQVLKEVKRISGPGVHIFLDEIQNVSGWEAHLRTAYDRKENINFVLSGSTLAMMGKEFQRRLAGRIVSFKVFPFSFPEAMRISNITSRPSDKDAVIGLIDELITTGGYPEIFLERDPLKKEKLLLEYYEGILSRDVSAAHGLDIDKAEAIALYLLRNVSSLTSINKLAKIFGISYLTAEKYLDAFKDSMVFFDVKRFAFSLKVQLSFPRKIYPFDLGFRWVVGKGHSADKGRLFESFVASELVKSGYKLFYWHSKRECDFVLFRRGNVDALLQVAWEINEANQDREEKGLLDARRALRAKGYLLTKSDLELFLNLLTKNEKV